MNLPSTSQIHAIIKFNVTFWDSCVSLSNSPYYCHSKVQTIQMDLLKNNMAYCTSLLPALTPHCAPDSCEINLARASRQGGAKIFGSPN